MPITISDIFKRNRAALAPLAGVTDSVYRRICAGFGATPVMTEMISSEGFVRGKPGDKTSRLLRFKESERPLGFQFFGADPGIMTEAVRKARSLKPDFIDINAGCPVRKVVSKGGGSALLRTPGVLQTIVSGVCAASDVPVTVKIRSGWDFGSVNAVEVARMCEDAGAGGIIVHPRTRSQGFGGVADWTVIRAVKKAISIPVIGSGDIHSPADAKRMLAQIIDEHWLKARAVVGLFPANSVNDDDIEIFTDDSRKKVRLTLHHLRQQTERPPGKPNRCPADFVAPKATGLHDYVGSFVTIIEGAEEKAAEFEKAHDDYNAIMVKALADRLAEAFAEHMHDRVRHLNWGFEVGDWSPRSGLEAKGFDSEKLIREDYTGIRPAPGYPACPDHTEKSYIWELLDAEKASGAILTES